MAFYMGSAGSVVYIVFFIPVYESILTHEIASTLTTVGDVEYAAEYLARNFFTSLRYLQE
jgi:hypothetical protein